MTMKMNIVEHFHYNSYSEEPGEDVVAYCSVCGLYEGDPGVNVIVNVDLRCDPNETEASLQLCEPCKAELIKTLLKEPEPEKIVFYI